jgi:hypothetical protein
LLRDIVGAQVQYIRCCSRAREVELQLFDVVDMTVTGITGLDAPKNHGRAVFTFAAERELAEVIFRDPGFGRGGNQLTVEKTVGFVHFSKGNAGQVAVPPRVGTLWGTIVLSALVLILL